MENIKEYNEELKSFKDSDLRTQKRLLIETLVFCGYDITPYCEQYNTLSKSTILDLFKDILKEKLSQ